MALPPLRQELSVYPGPVGYDGAPSWTLQDPLQNKFYRLSWPVFEILSRWHLESPQAIAQSVTDQTTLEMDEQDVGEVVQFLAANLLLQSPLPQTTDRLLAMADAAKSSVLTWLLHHYLFFRIPLVRPDRLLQIWAPHVAWLGGRGFRLATLGALICGLFLIGRQWDSFAATFVDHFSLTGLAAFGVALGCAKVVHELGHAFVAKSYGCRVPTMGVAFLVMWPVLYTDVNDVWKLTDRRQRLMVGGAGILSELTIAAWAGLAWGLLPDGVGRSMAFTLAATTWISSLAINLSPFMRFDGYFLLMDALDSPNLHPRSFALARWHLREVLFCLREPKPEILPPRRHVALILFAWGVWLYRLILFLGIAVLVYHFFIKAVGVVLFMVEIGWFVIKPLAMEVGQWRARWSSIAASRRSRLSMGLCLALILLAVIPWDGRVSAPAMLKSARHVALYAPSSAILQAVPVQAGDRVTTGQPVVHLANPDLEFRQRQVERRIAVLRYELSAVSFDDTFRSRTQSLGKELEAALAEQSALSNEQNRMVLLSPLEGVVTDPNPAMQVGQWVNAKEPILSIRHGAMVEAYVAEDDLPRLQIGGRATFIPEGSAPARQAVVSVIDRTSVRALGEPALATQFSGPIPTRIDRQTLVPDVAVYRVQLTLDTQDALLDVPVRGRAQIQGDYRSFLGWAVRHAAAVLIREWGV